MLEFNTEFASVDYIDADNVVLLIWKKEAHGLNYRKPTLFALEQLCKNPNSNFIVDARNGFEDNKADVEWGFCTLLPAMAETTCKQVCFIMNQDNTIEDEMDMWTVEFSKYFEVHRATDYDKAVSKIKNSNENKLRIAYAEKSDIPELYKLQLISFESEALMIGNRDIPALLETKEENAKDFINWNVFKLISDSGKIIGSIRYRKNAEVIEVGRLMVHPEYRHQGLAQKLLSQVDLACPNETKELYTSKKSWTNICLYEKMGYKLFKEQIKDNGLTFVYMRKI